MIPVIVVDSVSGTDPRFTLKAQGCGYTCTRFKVQMLRKVKIIPESALRNGMGLMGLDHVGKGQRRRLMKGCDIGAETLGLRQK